jgi:hypothetical protein
MAVSFAWLAALLPVRGSLRLVVIRWLVSILAALPAVVVAFESLRECVARQPWFTEAPVPFPLAEQLAFLARIPGALWAALAASALLGFVGHLVVTAGALEVLDPARVRRGVLTTLLEAGSRYLWVFLRIALIAGICLVLGQRLLGLVFERLCDYGELHDWTDETVRIWLRGARFGLMLLGATLIGVMAWWLRVVVVATDRLSAVGALGGALRMGRRHPFQAICFQALLSLVALGVGGAVLVLWRQAATGHVQWAALWLAALFVQAVLWHWRLRASLILWKSGAPRADRRTFGAKTEPVLIRPVSP